MKNIVIFSSGISEKNGVLNIIKNKLESNGHRCSVWRDLFSTSNDISHISLLPMLIKKIPTFDYAVLICEGHDKTTMIRGDKAVIVNAMRDNVLFEIGLCSMALGLSKTILITDDSVRLPDDLVGAGNQIALKRVICKPTICETAIDDSVIEQIEEHIKIADNIMSPVVIGAASSTALGYLKNFVIRTFAYIEKGFMDKDNQNKIFFDLENIYIHIWLPEAFKQDLAEKKKALGLKKGHIEKADFRGVDFEYRMEGDSLHIYDCPSTMATSYDTAKMILEISADDTMDSFAEERFALKEIGLFYATIKSLLNRDFILQTVNGFRDLSEEEKSVITDKICSMMHSNIEIVRVPEQTDI